jgi:hypothetical protein
VVTVLPVFTVTVVVFSAVPSIKLFAWGGGGIVEDMCYMTYDEPRLVWTLVTVLQSLSQYYSRCHSRCQSDSLPSSDSFVSQRASTCHATCESITQHAKASTCHASCCVSATQKARATDRGAKCTDRRDQKVNTSSPEPLSLVFQPPTAPSSFSSFLQH